jgi:hypothetical protein
MRGFPVLLTLDRKNACTTVINLSYFEAKELELLLEQEWAFERMPRSFLSGFRYLACGELRKLNSFS